MAACAAAGNQRGIHNWYRANDSTRELVGRDEAEVGREKAEVVRKHRRAAPTVTRTRRAARTG